VTHLLLSMCVPLQTIFLYVEAMQSFLAFEAFGFSAIATSLVLSYGNRNVKAAKGRSKFRICMFCCGFWAFRVENLVKIISCGV